MEKPALLIGLGGTGQWVLTYVKKELLDMTRGGDRGRTFVLFRKSGPPKYRNARPD